jgi:hypothetical protein
MGNRDLMVARTRRRRLQACLDMMEGTPPPTVDKPDGGGHGPPTGELRGAPRACRADVAPDIGLGLLRVIAQPADVVAYARPDVVFGLVASVGAYAGEVHGRVAVYPAWCKGRAADIGYHFADGVEYPVLVACPLPML